mgnify:CR=1 FL=1
MARGKPHDRNIRAQAVAAIVAGSSLPDAARRFGISLGTIKGWWAEDRPVQPADARTREQMAALIYDTIGDILRAVRDQLSTTVRDEGWLAEQNAGDVAALLGAEVDSAIRLLSGFRPAEPEQQAIDAGDVVDAAARPADDGD